MTSIGYFLSSEEHTATELVEGAVLAERAGFRKLAISDHFHPWLRAQGESPFLWSVLGGIAQATAEAEVVTAVVCPTIRIHPAIVAQATATTQQMFGGRLTFGIGSGEALNEHIHGDRWPPIEIRHEMLEEAMGIIRRLWSGRTVDHHGRHYTVENARCTPCRRRPRASSSRVRSKRRSRSRCDRGRLLRRLAGRAAAAQLSRAGRHRAGDGRAQDGPDPEGHVAAIQAYVDARFDQVYVAQMGPDQRDMIDFYRRHVLPRFA